MKKQVLITFSMAVTLLAGAQSVGWKAPQLTEAQREYQVAQSKTATLNFPTGSASQANLEEWSGPVQRSAIETQIGQTTYDLQTNSAVQRRIINHPSGAISAVWTMSTDMASGSPPNFTTRGTGYNFKSSGGNWGSMPTTTLEPVFTGWPNLLTTSSGKEIVISHNNDDEKLRFISRPSVGSGSWTDSNLNSLDIELWSKAATGGPSNNTIHLIGMTVPVANDGNLYEGADGALLYCRSSNAGATWDIVNLKLPQSDTAFFPGFDGDSYAIDANGNNVAVVYAGLGTGVQLWKSTNNGATWTKKDVVVPRYPNFEEATTFIDPAFENAMYTADGSCHVLIDNNGMAHVWFGRMFIANETVGDDLINFFPFQNGIEYWNEGYVHPQPMTIAGMPDSDGNGLISIADNTFLASYRFSGLAGYPSAGIDANGCIYVSYSAVHEELDNGLQNYRHVFVVKSCDGGCSWTAPVDVTGAPSNNFNECVFPSIARRVDSDIHILYQQDIEPGISLNGDEDDVSTNRIIYLKEAASAFGQPSVCAVSVYGDTFLCTGGTLDLYALGCATSYTWAGPGGFSATGPSVQVTDHGTYTVTFTTAECGNIIDTINVVPPTSGSNPIVNITSSASNICTGGTATLTATSNVAGSNFSWSTGDLTPSTTISAPGTYTVTVGNCTGTTITSFTIGQPAVAPDLDVTGPGSMCSGTTDTLFATSVANVTSYLWSDGTSDDFLVINGPGTYSVTAANCVGSTVATFDVEGADAPDATIVANMTEACEGEQILLTATSGISFVWSNGETTNSIALDEVSESGTYSVTATACGTTDDNSITVTIHPVPATPTISVSGTTLTSSSATGNQWYVNGSPISGATGQTFEVTTGNFGKSITVVVTNSFDCSATSTAKVVPDPAQGLSELSMEDFKLYPNPNSGEFEIAFGNLKGKVNITVTNAIGQKVYAGEVSINGSGKTSLDLSNQDKGVYQLSIEQNGFVKSKTFVIQ